jgi:hypothetical protein
MFTFLPRSYRAEVEREYRKRVLAIALGLSTLLALSACALAAPSFIILSVKKAAASLDSKKSGDLSASAGTDTAARIKDIKAKTSVLKTVSAAEPLASVLGRITARMIPGVKLSGIALKRSVDQGAIVVSGVAATRDDLVAFSKSLQGEPSFKNISLPVSTLAKATDIGFSISIDSSF